MLAVAVKVKLGEGGGGGGGGAEPPPPQDVTVGKKMTKAPRATQLAEVRRQLPRIRLDAGDLDIWWQSGISQLMPRIVQIDVWMRKA